jgi:hypothetical protein
MGGVGMGPITTVTKFIEIEKSTAAQDNESLFRRFERMQSDALSARVKCPASFDEKNTLLIHRLSVRTYHFYISSDTDQAAR